MESVFNNACYVIGAGVSAAALGPYTPCSSWGNLVEECFSYCKNQNLLSAEQCDEIESNISSLKKPNSNASDAADKLTGIADTLFKSMGKTRFENWIQGICHDGLQIKNYSLLDALIKAPGIILTTNYDLLIEERCRQKSVEYISFTWQDPKAIQYALKRCNKKIIIHIHGSIQKPESIIFTSEQYNELSQSIANDRIFQSIMTAYKLYVVGAGSGLRDLDFSRQFKDFTSIFNVTTSESESYLLYKSDLIEEFRNIANQYSFKLIDFGENYEDLPIYIEKMNSENKFLEKEKELKDLINQDFSNYKEISQVEDAAALIMPMGFCLKNPSDLLESSSTHERLGVSYIEQSSKRVFCLVAEGESGLTTGLREFALDFISDKFYVYSLNKNELDRVDFLSSNCIHPCIFVIDNFALDSVKKFRAFCKKINISNNEDKFLIGCGMKSCEKIATLLQEQDIDSCILYLDKVRKHDIDLCAKAYFPENSFLQKRSSDLVFRLNYLHISNRFGEVINKVCSEHQTSKALLFSILVYEDLNRPQWIRRIENILVRLPGAKLTVGIAQVTSTFPLSDTESIELASEKLAFTDSAPENQVIRSIHRYNPSNRYIASVLEIRGILLANCRF